MNYEKIYNDLIDKHGTYAKPKDGQYYERHRKIPGHAGGEYVEGNAFYVPARVHYIAHLLLARVTGHQKDWLAAWGMMNVKGRGQERDYRVNSYIYTKAREACLPAWKEINKKAHAVKDEKTGKSKHAVMLGSLVAARVAKNPEHFSELGRTSAKKLHEAKDENGKSLMGLRLAAATNPILHQHLAHARKHGESSPYWGKLKRMEANRAAAMVIVNKKRAEETKEIREECKALCKTLGIPMKIASGSNLANFIRYRDGLLKLIPQAANDTSKLGVSNG